ncbi:MAG TPA: alpha-2-macroglobulin family protein [Chitinispirillaceae bacterium]|nr:alpha-2-macroglobulin family protein [Chitinispirillaceae bacterium]
MTDLTPKNGNIPLKRKLKYNFLISDSLVCLGLFRNDKKVNPSDSFFLEDDYTLQFNRSLHPKATEDYFRVNGKPYDGWVNDANIDISSLLRKCKSCTLTFETGMPSYDSAFLFKDLKFILNGDSGRIDPDLAAFKINSIVTWYDSLDSLPSTRVINKQPVLLTPSLQFRIVTDFLDSITNAYPIGEVYCAKKTGNDTLYVMNIRNLALNTINLVENTNYMLIVKAGFRFGGYQLKQDYVIPFSTGPKKFPNSCRSVLNTWDDSHFLCQYSHSAEYVMLPETPTVPVERFGNGTTITAIRPIPFDELQFPFSNSPARFKPHGWYFDTLPPAAAGTDWYEYLPISLTKALSYTGRGTAEVLLKKNESIFDTIGRVQVTDIGLQIIRSRLVTAIIATSLTHKTPLPDVEITLFDKEKRVLAKGTTDTSGLFLLHQFAGFESLAATLPGDTVVFLPSKKVNSHTVANGTIITERPLYRPGDSLYFKGIVRKWGDRWEPLTGDTAIVSIEWDGAPLFTDTLTVTGCGSFTGTTMVPYTAARTCYTINVRLLHAVSIFSTNITVADYRPSELSATLENSRINQDSILFPVSARWLHGGEASGCPVSWTISVNSYHTSAYDGNFSWKKSNYNSSSVSFTGNTILDSTGCANIMLHRLDDDSGMVYRCTAVCTGSSMQSVRIINFIAIPQPQRIMMGFHFQPCKFIGDSSRIFLKSTYENGKVATYQPLSIIVKYFEPIKRKGKNRYGLPAVIRDTIVHSFKAKNCVSDSEGMVVLPYASLEKGKYLIMVTPSSSSDTFTFDFYFYNETSGRTNVYRRTNEDYYISVDDSRDFNVGDSVQIRLKALRDSCAVIVTVRRENLYEYRWLRMTGNDTTITFAIKDAYIPNVEVSATFIQPATTNAGGLTFNQPPGVIVDSKTINISDKSRNIPVTITTDSFTYAPGDSVTVLLTVPPQFSSAKALLMVVDQGVLSLFSGVPPELLGPFKNKHFFQHDLIEEYKFRCFHGPFNYDSCNALQLRPKLTGRIGRRGVAGIGYGCGYGSGFGGSGSGYIDDLIGGLMGGDGGGGLDPRFRSQQLRNPPRPCALFSSNVIFNSDGKASCCFKLPGNLTRWRITAVIDDTTSFGIATASFVTNKPLMIRPQLPHFLRAGDSALIDCIAENRTDSVHQINVSLEHNNDKLIDTFTLNKNSIRHVKLPFIMSTTGNDSLTFRIQGNDINDGIRIHLPRVTEQLAADIFANAGSTTDSTTITIDLPDTSKIDSGSIALHMSTTRFQQLHEGVRYLFEYPYGCLEQQSSRIYPLVMLHTFASRYQFPLLIKNDEDSVITTYLAHIKDYQNKNDGGLGYWPTDSGTSDIWLTAFVLEICNKAKQAGFSVDESITTPALKYLLTEMRKPGSDYKKRFLDSYTQLVAVLYGEVDQHALSQLFKTENSLPLSGRINLLRAMYYAGGFKRQVMKLQKQLRYNLVERDRLAYFEPEQSNGFEFCHETNVRQTALALEALLETGAKSRFDEPMVRWLLQQRRNGRWRTTQENIAVFRAFAAYAQVYESESPLMQAAATIDRKQWYTTSFDAFKCMETPVIMPFDSIASKDKTAVTISQSGSGRLYYDLLMSTYPQGKAMPVQSGFSITRKISSFDNTLAPNESLKLVSGINYLVEISVRCNTNISFVAIEDPIPAGCEAVNPDLISADQGDANVKLQVHGLSALSYREFRDSRVLFFFNEMESGEYRITYLLKATTPGKFLWPAPKVTAMYYPEFHGRGEENEVQITTSVSR